MDILSKHQCFAPPCLDYLLFPEVFKALFRTNFYFKNKNNGKKTDDQDASDVL